MVQKAARDKTDVAAIVDAKGGKEIKISLSDLNLGDFETLEAFIKGVKNYLLE